MTWKQELEQPEDMKVHTPQMFVQVTYLAAKWLLDSGYDRPMLMLDFDDVLADPDVWFGKLWEFLGEGDFSGHPVEKRLKRSEPAAYDHELWEAADQMYIWLKEQKYTEIVEYFEAHELEFRRENLWVQCTRLDQRMAANECRNCQQDLTCRTNFRKQADRNNIDWMVEPCIYDCIYNPDADHVTVQESIENNHWRDTL